MNRFFVCLLFLLLIGCAAPAARAETRLMVVSDLHYLAPELYEGSDIFLQALRRGDGKMPQAGEILMAGLRAETQAQRPDALIVTGDLAFNGEKRSHEELARWFALIEQDGTPVWVLPGNHDINVESPVQFVENGWRSTANVDDAQFAAIYQDFMLPAEGSGAGLSYHVPVNDSLWLALMDVSFREPKAQVFGQFTEDHAAWLADVLSRAEQAGAEVISCSHQSLIAHTEFSRDSYLMFGSDRMLELMRQYHGRLNLSGHLHIQHIAQAGGVTDAATGGFCMSPHRYAIVTLRDDGTLTYEARSLGDSSVPEGFLDESRDWFLSISREKSLASMAALEIPEDEKALMADYSSRFHYAYFSGEVCSSGIDWQREPGYLLLKRYGLFNMDFLMDEGAGNQLARVLEKE